MELSSALGKEIDNTDPREFVRALTRFVCFPESSVPEEKLKPENTVLNQDGVEKLSDEDLELIATTYLNANDYLYRESITKTSDDPNGGTRLSIEKGEIKYPQLESETKVEYLHRISGLNEVSRQESTLKMANKFRHFSDKLGKDIRNTLSLGEAFRRTLGTVKPIAYEIPALKSNFDDIVKQVKEKEERQLRPLKDLSEKMDKLVEQSMLASDFMVENNRVQAGIAEELKESGDKAAGFSKDNLFLTKIVIAITIISILFSIFLFYVNRSDSENDIYQTKDNVENITEAINILNKNLMESNNGKNVQLQNILEELRLQRIQTAKRIENLEKEVRDLEMKKEIKLTPNPAQQSNQPDREKVSDTRSVPGAAGYR